ncbi:MAG TPA: type II secretion system protein, partial [Candidatus Binatia bacterium]|nr:type II secretion system protein [Candidatus Binatia bacterium]
MRFGTNLNSASLNSEVLRRGVNENFPALVLRRPSLSRCSAFTLAEVLAALLFMAIVIPVAVQGLHIASQAGEVAQRKSEAARVAERILNENIVTTNSTQSSQSGTVSEGRRDFRWTLQSQTWSQTTTNQPTALSSTSGQLASGQP